MPSLRDLLASHGFESNEDYDYIINCLLGYGADRVRCLNVVGDPGRRKTAFATALAHSLEYPQLVYHDCSQAPPTPAPAIQAEEAEDRGKPEPPVPEFDRALSDACAQSEGERTVLILDQLQAAEFSEHIRLYRFVTSGEWHYRDATLYANPRNLLLFLVSEEPVYHSLQKHSFRVWVSGSSLGHGGYRPSEFGLGAEAGEMMNALDGVFELIGVRPTRSEYARILDDIQHRVRTGSDLAQSIFGWTEGVDRELLMSPPVQGRIDEIMPAVEAFLGVDHVTLVGLNFPDDAESL